MAGQAPGLPLGVVQIVPGIEELEEIHAPEVGHGLHSGAFHLHADCPLGFPAPDLFRRLPVGCVGGPGGALHIRAAAVGKDLMEYIPVFAVHVDEVRSGGIVIAAALVPNGPGWDDNSAVLNGPVQYPAVAEEDELFQAHGNQILKVPNAGGFPYSGLVKGNALAPVVHGVDRGFPIGTPYPTDTLRLKKGKNGIVCDTCNNATDLLDMMRKKSYDLLITDLKMAEVNGIEILEMMRMVNVRNSKTIPVVVMTAAPNVSEQELLDAGFVACLFKPMSDKDLINTARKCVNGKIAEKQKDFLYRLKRRRSMV